MFHVQSNWEKRKKIWSIRGSISSRHRRRICHFNKSMTRHKNSDDLWLQTAAKHLKVQISHSDIWG